MWGRFRGSRKVFIFSEALVAFVFMAVTMQIRDAATILAIGTSICSLCGVAVYGNIQERKSEAKSTDS